MSKFDANFDTLEYRLEQHFKIVFATLALVVNKSNSGIKQQCSRSGKTSSGRICPKGNSSSNLESI